MKSRPSDDPHFVNTVKKAIGYVAPGVASQLGIMLGPMLTRLGSIISTGYWTAISDQSTSVRVSILQSWQQSWFFLWPILARIFITLSKACWTRTNKRYLQLNGCDNYRADIMPGPAFDFDFLQFEESPEPATVETDVVIIRSGSGGAVCAKVLAEAGLRVLVTDKGYHFPPDQFPIALDRLGNIFQGGAGLASADGSTLVTAGMCWGGGGTVNCLDRVCKEMGVSHGSILENHSNKVRREGLHKLNWRVASVLQNTGGISYSCGSNCGRGCRTGKKQSTSTYWLPAAAHAGARFIEGFDVSEVLIHNGRSPKAVGVTGLWKSPGDDGIPDTRPERQQLIEVRAKTVILAAGTLNTPLILQRSGIKNPNIGKNLFLHPVANVAATWSEDVQPWKGDILSSVVTEFENLDGHGHGVKIESTVMQPCITMILFPWENGAAYKAAALQYRNITCHISICRNKEPGSVSIEPNDGSPVINYSPSKFDHAHIIKGAVAIAQLCYMSGARGIFPAVPGVSPFHCSTATADRTIQDEEFVEWLRTLETSALDPLRTTYDSAHQMGSSRMGINPDTSVVDKIGKVWGYDGLYVADASVFPSASGVNPMITVMAIADRISRGIATQSSQ
ncbi:long-chain fatty alcohol dehydrogenase [Xylariaceae sp. FL1272]|nr:long-chain fatty alcohol dehydrogenase [Xylariaceae sp. FL1272]